MTLYQIVIPNSVKKDIKRIDRAVARAIIHQLEQLTLNPYLGTRLSGDLSQLFKQSPETEQHFLWDKWPRDGQAVLLRL